MRLKNSVLAPVVISALALSASPALAADAQSFKQPKPRAADRGLKLSGEIKAALQRDLGLSAEEVKQQGAQQRRAIKLDQTLQASLGDAFAGSSFDDETGKLTVNVSDAAQLDEAKAAGADVQLVENSKAELESIQAELDAAAGKADGTTAAERKVSGDASEAVEGVRSWYVDTESNTVHVTVAEGEGKEAAADLA